VGSRVTPAGGPSRVDAAETLLGSVDRPARLQMVAVLVLGIVLVAIPAYLWRRPRSEAVTVTSQAGQAGQAGSAAARPGGALPESAPIGSPPAQAAPPADTGVALSEARVMECHDPGSKRTPPTECDHLAPIEKGLAQAIQANAACLPTAAGGGSLVYVVDVSFQRKRNPVALTLPRDGRALKNPRSTASSVAACGSAVKRGLAGVTLDGIPHAHARYKIAITASYTPPTK
jgi:hypothetical protein